MAKELPFFRFNVSEWLTGNIAYESYEIQGLFIKVCCEYWNRNNCLTIEEIKKQIDDKSLKLSIAGRKGGLSKAKARLKHKEIEREIDNIKKEKKIKHWNENLPTGI